MRIACGLALLVIWSAWGLGRQVHLSASAQAANTTPNFVPSTWLPFAKKYCLNCHGATRPKAGLNLADWNTAAAIEGDLERLDAVLLQLRDQTMPPEDKPQPTPAERAAVVAGLDHLQQQAALKQRPDPGRVTLRRLNRSEYNNTIRDLLGVEFTPADDFPSDDVGYGFDHIGDVLTLSPLLMEKYLRAAERITEQGLTVPPPPKPVVRRILAREFKAEPPQRRPLLVKDGRYRGLERGELLAAAELSAGGKYRLKLQAVSEPAGDDPAKLVVEIPDLPPWELAPSEKGQPFTQEIQLPAGSLQIRIRFANPFREEPPAEAEKNEDGTPAPKKPLKVRRVGVEFLELEGPLDAPSPPPPPAYARFFVVRPGPDLSPREAARQILAPLAERAFRRPVSPEEIEKVLAIFDLGEEAKQPFEASVRLAVQAILVSPHFLFRVERAAPAAGQADAESLDSFALASRLSYFLWSSMPDEELFELARTDRLRDPAVLAAQTRRMLKDPKARALTRNFAGQWLQLRNLETVVPDPQMFKDYDEDLREAFRQETELFFQALLVENRPISDFLVADFTFLNERLARFYGIQGVTGPEFRRVELSDPRRGGLLTQASILTVTSNPTRTSPVKRGKFILENLLASPVPPPPPDAGELEEGEQAELSGSLRQRMEQHRSNPTCASCHARMDPLGFGLENYDAIGRWREKDGNFAIDPSGVLPDGRSFRDVPELKTTLRGRLADFRRCLVEKMLTYALGRGLEVTDRPSVARLCESLQAEGDRFAELLVAVATSEPFRNRRPATR